MIVARSKPNQEPLSAVVNGLDRIFKPDPIIPEAMLALLKAMDAPPAFIAAAARPRVEALHP